MEANNATMVEYFVTLDMAKQLAMVENNQTTLYSQLVRQARFTNITKHKPFQMRFANRRKL